MLNWQTGFLFEAETDQGNGSATEPKNQGSSQPANQGAFSQEDLDRIVGKTRAEARQTGRNELLQELGIDDFDNLKTIIQSAQERAEAEKTAQQKLAELQGANTRAKQLEQRFEAMVTDAISKIPEEHREKVQRIADALPTPEAKLDAINLQLELFNNVQPAKPTPPKMNATEGSIPQGGNSDDDDMTPAQKQLRQFARNSGYIRRK